MKDAGDRRGDETPAVLIQERERLRRLVVVAHEDVVECRHGAEADES